MLEILLGLSVFINVMLYCLYRNEFNERHIAASMNNFYRHEINLDTSVTNDPSPKDLEKYV